MAERAPEQQEVQSHTTPDIALSKLIMPHYWRPSLC